MECLAKGSVPPQRKANLIRIPLPVRDRHQAMRQAITGGGTMSVFCQLASKNGAAVYVNPELVRFVAAAPDGGTIVNFSDGKGIAVSEEPQKVAAMLSMARNATPAKRPEAPKSGSRPS